MLVLSDAACVFNVACWTLDVFALICIYTHIYIYIHIHIHVKFWMLDNQCCVLMDVGCWKRVLGY